jgi:hypothetical protein
MHAAIHPLTPGSPAYAVAKLGAVGGLIALKMALARRDQRSEEREDDTEPASDRAARPHPVSRRKARRRRKRR